MNKNKCIRYMVSLMSAFSNSRLVNQFLNNHNQCLNTKLEINNRIGINLNRPEKETINTRFKEFIPGKLLIKQDRYDEYKWVLCMNNMNNNTVNIMTDIKNRQVEDCNTHSLFGIPPTEKITPLGIEENKIIETYVTNYT